MNENFRMNIINPYYNSQITKKNVNDSLSVFLKQSIYDYKKSK